MRVLFHVEPLLFHGRPFHYWALLDFCVTMSGWLRASRQESGDTVETRFLTNQALTERAIQHDGAPANDIHTVLERDLQDVTGRSAMNSLRALQSGEDAQLEERLAGFFAKALDGFRPDVIVTISPSPYWRRLFPGVTLLHFELGLFSRHPYPHVFYLYPLGVFRNSVPGVYSGQLKAMKASGEDQALLGCLRTEFTRRILNHTPFNQLEMELRARYRRLLLLPLQFAGEFGFDLHCYYDRQGSFLIDVIQRVSPDTAVIVAEHPTALWLGDKIDDQTREFVRRYYPNVFFAPGAAEGLYHAGQILLHHVDAVASVSSSLGMQAVFFNKPLLALGSSHLAQYAAWRSVEEFNREAAQEGDWTGAMAWLLRHYYLPVHLCQSAGSFHRRIRALASASADQGLSAFPAITSDSELLRALLLSQSITQQQ